MNTLWSPHRRRLLGVAVAVALAGCATESSSPDFPDVPDGTIADAPIDAISGYDTGRTDAIDVADDAITDARSTDDVSDTSTTPDTQEDVPETDVEPDVRADVPADAVEDVASDVERDAPSDAGEAGDAEVDAPDDTTDTTDAAEDAPDPPDPCEGFVCDATPADACEAGIPTTYGPGTCVVDEDTARCTYEAIALTACDAASTRCVAGACQPGYVDLDVGGDFRTAHACAVRFDGLVHCWGNNIAGQLGAITEDDSVVSPVEPSLAAEAVQVACGANHSCALDTTGAVWCWGANAFGQLGHADGSHSEPRRIEDLENVEMIAAGGNATWAIDASGQLWHWGGVPPSHVDRSSTPRVYAVNVRGIEAFRRGAVWNTADSAHYVGELGTGFSLATTASPLPFEAGTDIAIGWDHGCLVDGDAMPRCFGRDDGMSGDPTSTAAYQSTPVVVNDATPAFATAVAANAACAVVGETREVYCWGYDENGSLGRRDTTEGPFGARVTFGFLRRVVELEAGWNSFLVRTEDGRVWAWGFGESDVLGDRGDEDNDRPNPLILPTVPAP